MASQPAMTVRIADMEPMSRFVRRVAQAHAHFYALTAAEMQRLPDKACRGVAELQAALGELDMMPERGESDD